MWHPTYWEAEMKIALSGKQRIGVSIAIGWVLFCLFQYAPWEYQYIQARIQWEYFFKVGLMPIVLILAVIWIRSGMQQDKHDDFAKAEAIKQSVTCPGCNHQVHRKSIDQLDFKCTRCNTMFRYCPSCGASNKVA
jgi:hypothetical protein